MLMVWDLQIKNFNKNYFIIFEAPESRFVTTFNGFLQNYLYSPESFIRN